MIRSGEEDDKMLKRLTIVCGALGLGAGHVAAHHPGEGRLWVEALEHLLEWDHLAMIAAGGIICWLIFRKVRAMRQSGG
jgi:hypothetical protein